MALRRIRSSTVVLGGMGVLAAALTSCSSEPDKRCVDRGSYDYARGYRVVDDRECSGTTTGSGAGGAAGSGGQRGTGGYGYGGTDGQWYYGGKNNSGYVNDGSFVRSRAVDRGGFGCSGSGSRGG
ncbi:hypothetical protein [Streptomyces alkaliterrae]|uniref:Lipoprotein n=1 Tax=Streptomyces alkaliterrae TaxID=2213162 RepID=A0A5P0YZY0_9ACTN|nr:hypothetical protein [Streptomyces alkaliterrae]MBB1257101.1 hypothetical protein [Streptomyces alkaliterrae]MBB1262430.1 hypothetical protein [Streptomyces alkaliterrae]MQS05497.1 hypothetical protein [Streptomyces alkaliterrae]